MKKRLIFNLPTLEQAKIKRLTVSCYIQYIYDHNFIFNVFSLSILHNALIYTPQILLDGPGVLKFADFGLARVEGENLDELFEQFYEAGESDSEGSEGEEKKLTTKGMFSLFNL